MRTGGQIPELVPAQNGQMHPIDAGNGIMSRLAVLSQPNAIGRSGTPEARCVWCLEQRDLIRRWLQFSLAEKQDDLKLYLDKGSSSLRDRLSASQYLKVLPLRIGCAARRLFQFGVVAALGAVRAEHYVIGHQHALRSAGAIKTILARRGSVQLCLKILSHEMGVSPNRFAVNFATTAGTSFRQYTRSVRLAAAAEMLSAPGTRTTLVAQALGYSLPSNFVRDFRTGLLLCPTRFKKEYVQASFVWPCPRDSNDLAATSAASNGGIPPFISDEALPKENCKSDETDGPPAPKPLSSESLF